MGELICVPSTSVESSTLLTSTKRRASSSITRITRLVRAQRDFAIHATLQIAPVRRRYQAARGFLHVEYIQRFGRGGERSFFRERLRLRPGEGAEARQNGARSQEFQQGAARVETHRSPFETLYPPSGPSSAARHVV